MAAGVQIPGNGETIDLQQQVARLQALLEASRQVHSTIREEEVLEQVLRIVVRELEMAGAAFADTKLVYGQRPTDATEGLLRYRLEDRDGVRMTDLLVAPPDGRELTIYEADLRVFRCRPPWRWRTHEITSATWLLPVCSRIWTQRG